MPLDWDKLRLFHVVAQAGSFTKAGADLGLSQSAVSRQISDLEARLKVSLFHRHARGLILTEPGELLQRTAREVYLKLKSAEAQITESTHNPSGELRVTTTISLGNLWLMPLVHEFKELYPQIRLDLILEDRPLDLSMREADIALRTLPSTRGDTTLISRHLMYLELKLYASRDYLARKGHPLNLADLSAHDLMAFPDDSPMPLPDVNWLLEAGMPTGQSRATVLRVNSYQALLTAVQSGMGIASLPHYLAQGHEEIEVVLPSVKIPRAEVFFVYAEELRNSVKVAVFRDFLLHKIGHR